jgi:hypothetical protein
MSRDIESPDDAVAVVGRRGYGRSCARKAKHCRSRRFVSVAWFSRRSASSLVTCLQERPAMLRRGAWFAFAKLRGPGSGGR